MGLSSTVIMSRPNRRDFWHYRLSRRALTRAGSAVTADSGRHFTHAARALARRADGWAMGNDMAKKHRATENTGASLLT